MKISKYNHRPIFFNTEASYKPSEREFITLYLDIQKDKILDYSFEHKGMDKLTEDFSKLGERILGKRLVEAREVTLGSEFLSLPLKLLQNALDKYRGQTYRFELLKEKSDTLICRCFGVFKGQITDVLKNDSEGHLLTVLDQTDATGGCSSCKHDVEKIIEEFRGEEVLFVPRKERVLGLTPAQLHLKLDEEIKKWSDDSEVCEIKNNLVMIKTKNFDLKKHLGETFGDDLLFSFLS